MQPRTLGQPFADNRCFVRTVVVQHPMNPQFGRHPSLDQVQKFAELHPAMAAMQLTDPSGGLQLQRGKQRGSPVAFVVVRAPLQLTSSGVFGLALIALPLGAGQRDPCPPRPKGWLPARCAGAPNTAVKQPRELIAEAVGAPSFFNFAAPPTRARAGTECCFPGECAGADAVPIPEARRTARDKCRRHAGVG